MWSGGSTFAVSGCGAYDAAASTRSLPTSFSSSGTGPIVSTWVSPGHFSSSASARSVKAGSITSVVMPASLIT